MRTLSEVDFPWKTKQNKTKLNKTKHSGNDRKSDSCHWIFKWSRTCPDASLTLDDLIGGGEVRVGGGASTWGSSFHGDKWSGHVTRYPCWKNLFQEISDSGALIFISSSELSSAFIRLAYPSFIFCSFFSIHPFKVIFIHLSFYPSIHPPDHSSVHTSIHPSDLLFHSTVKTVLSMFARDQEI